MISKILLVLLGVLFLVAIPQTASAHVLIRDDTKSVGAVLHLNPDDDPVAGQQSNLFFDVEGETIKSDSALLKVTDLKTNKTVDAPVTFTKTSVSSAYTFPSQGVYDLKLMITSPSSRMYIFRYSQRVARGGIPSGESRSATYPVATLGLTISTIGLVLTGIVVVNRRQKITVYSKL